MTDSKFQVLASTNGEDEQRFVLPLHRAPLTEQDIINDHLVIPLHVGNEDVGRLIIAATADCSEDSVHMAKTLAELIIHQRNAFEQMFDRQWALDKFICELLHGHFREDDEAALQNASLLDVDLEIPRVAITIDILPLLICQPSAQSAHDSFPEHHQRTLRHRKRQLIDLAQRSLGAQREHIYSFFDEQRFVILAAIDGVETDIAHIEPAYQRLQQAVQLLIDTLCCGTNVQISAGIGDYYPGWSALTDSYQDARFALETGCMLLEKGHVYQARDLGLATFVCAQNRSSKSALADRLLGPLLDKPELLQTLETFLAAGLSSSVAAERLQMHRHGLTYRLKKIQELTGLDPASFGDATQLAAALQWHHVVQTEPTSSKRNSTMA
ncbi:MAG: helix-turn-helix domain-containing protein [Caldilineaceae bacterium]|nr:helix-turn-helix domain-containing protein [Caldilineaceae bacterium]